MHLTVYTVTHLSSLCPSVVLMGLSLENDGATDAVVSGVKEMMQSYLTQSKELVMSPEDRRLIKDCLKSKSETLWNVCNTGNVAFVLRNLRNTELANILERLLQLQALILDLHYWFKHCCFNYMRVTQGLKATSFNMTRDTTALTHTCAVFSLLVREDTVSYCQNMNHKEMKMFCKW